MAVTLYRDLGYLGLAKQSSKGTGVTPVYFPKLVKAAFMPSPKVTDFRNGNQRDINFSVKETFLYKGSFQTFLYASEGAFIFAAGMGKDTKTGGGDPYTHTLDLTVDSLPYLTAEASYYENQILDRVVDSKIARLLLEAETGKEAMLTVDLLGSSVAVQGSAATVSFNDAAGEGPMMFYHGAFTLGGPTDAATLQGQIQKFSIDIDQGVVPVYGPGVVYPIALFEEGRKVTFKMTVNFSGPNLHDLIHYGASNGTAVSNNVTTGSFVAALTSASSPERSATLTCGYLNWKTSTPKFSPDGKTGTMDVEAVGYRSGSNYPFSAVFKTGVSTAYV